MNKPIDMKDLLNKLETINEMQDEGVVHASSTRALARDIVYYAKRLAAEQNIDISQGSDVWDGIMMRQLSDAIKGLTDHVSEARTDAEYLAGQDDRANSMKNAGDDFETNW